MKLSIIIFIIIIIIIILNKNIFNKFSNIKGPDAIANIYVSATINNIEFNIYYTTPIYYSANITTDDILLSASQKQFQPIPLLWLIDATNCPVNVDGTKATTIFNLNQFRYPSIQSLKNTPGSSTTTAATTAAGSNFNTSNAKGSSVNVFNVINITNLISNTSTARSISQYGGLVTNTSVPSICTIPKGNTIITTPLVIDRTYVLGISLMNGVTLPTSAPSSVWQGSKDPTSGIIYYYTPFLFKDFKITANMLNFQAGITTSNVSVINFGQL